MQALMNGISKKVLAPVFVASTLALTGSSYAEPHIQNDASIENIEEVAPLSQSIKINTELNVLEDAVNKISVLCDAYCASIEGGQESFEEDVLKLIAEDFQFNLSIFQTIADDIAQLESMRIERPVLYIKMKERSADLFDNFNQNPQASRTAFSHIAKDIMQFTQDYVGVLRAKAATEVILADTQIAYIRILDIQKKIAGIVDRASPEFGISLIAVQFLGDNIMQSLAQELNNKAAIAEDLRDHYIKIHDDMQPDLEKAELWMPSVVQGMEGEPAEAYLTLPDGIDAELLDAQALMALGDSIDISSDAAFRIEQRRINMISQNQQVLEKVDQLFREAAERDREASMTVFDKAFEGIKNGFQELDQALQNIERETSRALTDIGRESGIGIKNAGETIYKGIDDAIQTVWKGVEDVLREAKHGFCELTSGSQDNLEKDHNGDGENDEYFVCMGKQDNFQFRVSFNTDGIQSGGATLGEIPFDIPFETEEDRQRYADLRQEQEYYIREFNEQARKQFQPDPSLPEELQQQLLNSFSFTFQPADVLFSEIDQNIANSPQVTMGERVFIDKTGLTQIIEGSILETEEMIKELDEHPLGDGRLQVATVVLMVKFVSDLSLDLLTAGEAGIAIEAERQALRLALRRLDGVRNAIGVIEDFKDGRDASITLVLNAVPFMSTVNNYFALANISTDRDEAEQANNSSRIMLEAQLKKYREMLERIDRGEAPIDRRIQRTPNP